MKLHSKLILAATAIVLGTTLANAGGHLPWEPRQKAMKAVGANTKAIGDMLKGATTFDAAKANASLAAMQAAVVGLEDMFPDGSESAESEAGPKVFSDRAGFNTAIAKFQADLATAVAAAPQDKAAVQASFGMVAANCKSCHEAYRVKK